ncbi:MAG: ribonuclease HII [Acidimicrobiales bacterium]
MGASKIDLLEFERPLLDDGEVVVGLDEVGRGALAGPLFVGAVVLSSLRAPPTGLNDSKVLSRRQREDLEVPLREWCDDWALGSASALEIDEWGLRVALAVAATRALQGLGCVPTYALVDGPFNFLSVARPTLAFSYVVAPPSFADLACSAIVKGDRRSATIAAASVLAKVARDLVMVALHEECARYEWSSNKGYGTPAHLAALRRYGPVGHHRRSWSLPEVSAGGGETKIS